jgi:probable addiction module antidote protein
MSKKPVKRDSPATHRKHVARILERAFNIGDCDEICRAIGTAAKLHTVTDIAKKSGIMRETIYRSFVGGHTYPNLRTIVVVLEAMGFRLQVESKRGSPWAGPRRGYRKEKTVRETDRA